MADLIERSPYLWATHVWNLVDFGADARAEGGRPGRNQKGLVTFDRSVKKDAFYVYKAYWSDEPFVHIAGRRYVDRAESTTEVTVYSNQAEVSLWCDDQLIGTHGGTRVSRFSVPLTGEHHLTARSGQVSDTVTVRRTESPNPAYAMPVAHVTNWFDSSVERPEGFFSIHDTLGDIRSTPEGARLIDHLMEQAAANRGGMAANVSMTGAIEQILNRWTVAKLLSQAGGTLPPEQVGALNDALNRIPKPETLTKESQ